MVSLLPHFTGCSLLIYRQRFGWLVSGGFFREEEEGRQNMKSRARGTATQDLLRKL
jgi:hypothetical protein